MTAAADLKARLKLRPHVASDEYVATSVIGDYKMNFQGRRIMDVGANIGSFSVWACMQGAAEVWAYEPEPTNFDMLKRNTKGLNVECYEAALGLADGTTDLYIVPNRQNLGSASTTPFRGRDVTPVDVLSFRAQLAAFKPHGIKMDCEGAEWQLLTKPLPKYVREVAMELHLNKREWRESFDVMVEYFADWDCLRQPNNTGQNWHTLCHWRR